MVHLYAFLDQHDAGSDEVVQDVHERGELQLARVSHPEDRIQVHKAEAQDNLEQPFILLEYFF